MASSQVKMLRTILVILIVFVALSAIFFLRQEKNTIVIGTKNFTEQRILGNILATAIEDKTDLEVVVKSGLGETSFLQAAIQRQDIDIYVDYSSTAYEGVLKQKYSGQSSEEINQYIKTKYNQKFDLDWISMFGFENTNALICTKYCQDNQITQISDLRTHKDYRFAAPANFYERSDGFNLIEDTYKIELPDKNKLNMDSVLIYSATSSNDIDVGLAFTTDGRLLTDDYTVLSDNLNSFPKYDAGIIVSNQTIADNLELKQVLEAFQGTITNEKMQALNYAVDVEHQDEKQVAIEFYQENY